MGFTTDIYIAKDWGIVDDVQRQVVQLINPSDGGTAILVNLNPIESRNSMKIVSV